MICGDDAGENERHEADDDTGDNADKDTAASSVDSMMAHGIVVLLMNWRC